MNLALAGLVYLGMFALAASMSRHGSPLLGQWRRLAWIGHSAIGWGLFGLALLLACFAGDGGQALVLWFGLIPFASGLILLALTYRPAAARTLVPVAALCVIGGPFL